MTVRLPPAVRDEIEGLYATYVDLLDEGALEAWPALFSEKAVYRIVSRENVERGWPLATMSCESRAALEDRIYSIRHTSLYVPRSLRHLVGRLRISPRDEGFGVEASYAVFETLPDQLPRVFSTGRYRDRLERADDGVLRFAEKLCIYDSTLIPNSLIVPL
ncbi:MAG: aromatic-ring-hydroxylating dioxygenase subunit beta [Myxococcota bacterium]